VRERERERESEKERERERDGKYKMVRSDQMVGLKV
jgi:hypothetical protein